MPTNNPTTAAAIEPAAIANQTRPGEEMRPGPRPIQALHIAARLPGLNEIISAHGTAQQVRTRTGKLIRISKYDKLKKQWGERIAWEAKAQKLAPVKRAHFAFEWGEPDRRRDPDNIAAGGRKLILDALVKAGILANDGWQQIAGWSDTFHVGVPGVVVYIVEVE